MKMDARPAHAVLSASGAHRWIECPGSRKAERDIVEKSSVFAAEGTAAHFLGETCLKAGHDAEHYAGMYIYVNGNDTEFRVHGDIDGDGYFHGQNLFTVDTEMISNVQVYIDYVRDIKGKDGTLIVEQTVNFSDYVPDGYGTADAIVIHNDHIHVIDLKYGRGVKVDAEYNPQGMLYALGVLQDLGILLRGGEHVTVHIVMPRIDHISDFTISAEELYLWGDSTVKPAAQLAMTDNAPRNPGDKQCKFCKAKATCPALTKKVTDTALEGFGTVCVKLAEIPEQDRIAEVLDNLKLIREFCDAVEGYAKARLEDGLPVTGYKLVHGRSSKSWTDEEAVEKALRRKLGADKAYSPRKLISPSQAEKLLGKKDLTLQKYLRIRQGVPTLAPEDDKRPAISIGETLDGFGEVAN